MKRSLVTLLVILVVLSPSIKAQAYNFDFIIDKDFKVQSYKIKYDEMYAFFENDIPQSEENVKLIIKNNDLTTIYERTIPIHFFVYDLPIEQNTSPFRIYLPRSDQDNELQLLHNNEVILSPSLKRTLCNFDNACNNLENYYTCPADCAVNEEDNTCITFSDGFCDPDCYYDGGM